MKKNNKLIFAGLGIIFALFILGGYFDYFSLAPFDIGLVGDLTITYDSYALGKRCSDFDGTTTYVGGMKAERYGCYEPYDGAITQIRIDECVKYNINCDSITYNCKCAIRGVTYSDGTFDDSTREVEYDTKPVVCPTGTQLSSTGLCETIKTPISPVTTTPVIEDCRTGGCAEEYTCALFENKYSCIKENSESGIPKWIYYLGIGTLLISVLVILYLLIIKGGKK